SYLRLVPHQEAPTNICWGDRNRSVLIRVPLGWVGVKDMIKKVNPNYDDELKDFSDRQTFEFRCPDGSANIHLLLAGLCVGARHGLEMKNALEMAEKLYVDVNIFHEENKGRLAQLKGLPLSCYESAESLLHLRSHFEKDDVFSPKVIDGVAAMLMAYKDKGLSEKLYGKNDKIGELVEQYIHHM
ncbi:MAG TPA: glutamine synthetase, partial [Spirochaetota bacterium]|nr:glutamine synthetase [Spirochaetota bacterium]